MTTTSTPPIDAAALTSGLHQERAQLCARALAQRAVAEAATLQLEALREASPQRDAVAAAQRSAQALVRVLDAAAARLVELIQHVEAAKTRGGTGDTAAHSHTPLPVLRAVADQLGLGKQFAVAVDSPSTKPAERYDFVVRLVGAIEMSTGRGAEVSAATRGELLRLHADVASSLPGLDDVAAALTRMRDLWRRVGSDSGETLKTRVQRDLNFQTLGRHVEQMKLLRECTNAPSAADVVEYEKLADLVAATLRAMTYPGGEVQALAESVLVEVARLRGECGVVAAIRRLGERS